MPLLCAGACPHPSRPLVLALVPPGAAFARARARARCRRWGTRTSPSTATAASTSSGTRSMTATVSRRPAAGPDPAHGPGHPGPLAFNLDLLLPTRRVRRRAQGAVHPAQRPRAQDRARAPDRRRGDLPGPGDYAGHPALPWRGESNWLGDGREVVTMNQPHMAAWWFPANDHPRDKALMDIHVTVPQRRSSATGTRSAARSTGRATVHWRAEPMAPYLAFFAAGEFREAGHPRGCPGTPRCPSGSQHAGQRSMNSCCAPAGSSAGWRESSVTTRSTPLAV